MISVFLTINQFFFNSEIIILLEPFDSLIFIYYLFILFNSENMILLEPFDPLISITLKPILF